MAIVRSSTAARNAQVNAITALIDAGAGPGVMEIRSGIQPSSAQDAATGSLLGTVTFSDPAFAAASEGQATANAIASDTNADNSGQASWARVKDSNGNTVQDYDVTDAGGNGTVKLNNVNIVAGGSIAVTSMTIGAPAG